MVCQKVKSILAVEITCSNAASICMPSIYKLLFSFPFCLATGVMPLIVTLLLETTLIASAGELVDSVALRPTLLEIIPLNVKGCCTVLFSDWFLSVCLLGL